MRGGSGGDADKRRAQLADGLAAVAERVRRACELHGRDPVGLTTVVVTKNFPATDLQLLSTLGVTDVGENRDREAAAKLVELARLDPLARASLRVHLVGQVQTNKAASVARYADVVHSVDRDRLVRALSRSAVRAGRTLDVLVQVDLADGAAAGRGGAPRAAAPAIADLIDDSPGLRLRGVMAVAPLGAEPGAAFAGLAGVASGIRSVHPEATWVSAGMSADLEAAVANGATHLRVGSAILGARPLLR